jgi:hypothetical protein
MISKILDKIDKALDAQCGKLKPVLPLGAILLSDKKGMSALSVAEKVLERKQELGLPTGSYADGTANYDDLIILELVTQIQRDIRENAYIAVEIPAGTQIMASGSGPTGPVAVVGATTVPTQGKGVIT